MGNLENILQWVGLSENESKIYLTLLELWKSWVTEISKKSWIKRTTIYPYINKLLEKNLIKRTVKWKRILFTVGKPKNIITNLEEKKANLLKKIPILEELYKENSPNPSLEFYEWKKSLVNLYKKIWSSWTAIYSFLSPEEFYKNFSEEFDKSLWLLEKKAWWKTKTLIKNNAFSKKHIQNNPFSQIKLLPENFDLDIDIIIVWNSIIMISFEPLYAIVLKNKPLSDFHRNLHNYFWKML